MSLRFQRILIIMLTLALISAAATLIIKNSKKNIIFFYTPSELIKSNLSLDQKVRIGGFVKKNSIKKISTKKNYITFTVTDDKNDIIVEFKGILPDLFREGQGAVVEGLYADKKFIKAEKVFAKHDENYMPSSIKKQLKQTDYWKRNY